MSDWNAHTIAEFRANEGRVGVAEYERQESDMSTRSLATRYLYSAAFEAVHCVEATMRRHLGPGAGCAGGL